MKKSAPFFSIIVPVFNRFHLLDRTLKSIYQQTFKDFECIIIDDGSASFLNFSYFSYLEFDSRFELIRHKKNYGVSVSRNSGIKVAKAQWITFLDSDDEWLPSKLLKEYEYILERGEIKVWQSEEIWIRNGKYVNIPKHLKKEEGNLFERSLLMCAITPSSLTLNRCVFERVGIFDKQFLACEDYEIFLRITSKYKVGLIKEKLLIRYQGHENQLSFKYSVMDIFRIKALKKIIFSKFLSKEQRELSLEVLNKKIRIVLNGAKKRKRYFFVIFFKLKDFWYKLRILKYKNKGNKKIK